MKTLKIAQGLALPLDTVTQTIGILAKRRAGKSYAARRLAEQLFNAGQQIVITDPKGDWWGIRSSADGKSPGLPIVILGGERGDVPLEVGAGEVVAKLVVEERVSVLLDLSLLRKHEVATFMTAFLENLYRLKAREQYRTPMMLIVDEADAIAPQRPMKGEERMLGAAEDIVRRGGQRGIGCTLVTQRAAVLNKNVLTQIQLLVTLRTIAPQDLAAADAWIDVHGTTAQRKTLMESLPSLPQGDAWFWSPGWPTTDGIFQRVHVLPIETFDSGATPKPGEKRIEPKNLADVDLEALRTQMSATIERAKADNPKELKKRIAELERQLKQPTGKSEVNVGAEVAHRDRLVAAARRDMERQASTWERQHDREMGQLRAKIEKAGKIAKALSDALTLGPSQPFTIAFTQTYTPEAKTHPRAPQAAPRPASPAPTTPDVKAAATRFFRSLLGVQQRILNALAELEVLGVGAPDRVQVAFLSGYSHLQSTGFVKAIGAMRTAGLIDYPTGGKIALTKEGKRHASFPESPSSTEEIQQRILSLLGGVHGRILTPLIAAYPDPLAREDLAARAGYTHLQSTGFVKAIGRLRSLGFIDYPDKGRVIAQPVLFLEETK